EIWCSSERIQTLPNATTSASAMAFQNQVFVAFRPVDGRVCRSEAWLSGRAQCNSVNENGRTGHEPASSITWANKSHVEKYPISGTTSPLRAFLASFMPGTEPCRYDFHK